MQLANFAVIGMNCRNARNNRNKSKKKANIWCAVKADQSERELVIFIRSYAIGLVERIRCDYGRSGTFFAYCWTSLARAKHDARLAKDAR